VSHATAEDVHRRIEVSAAPVYVVAQGKGMREPELKKVLDRVFSVSGGCTFYTDRVEEFDRVFSEIAEDLVSQYFLAYVFVDAESDGGWRTIRVEVTGVGKGKHTVRARQGYRAVVWRR
jgi:hypothetical protein